MNGLCVVPTRATREFPEFAAVANASLHVRRNVVAAAPLGRVRPGAGGNPPVRSARPEPFGGTPPRRPRSADAQGNPRSLTRDWSPFSCFQDLDGISGAGQG